MKNQVKSSREHSEEERKKVLWPEGKPVFSSRGGFARIILSLATVIIAGIALFQVLPIINRVDVDLASLENEMSDLSNNIDDLADEISDLEERLDDGASWHVLYSENVSGSYSGKFLIPPEASKIRVVWGESLHPTNPNGKGYLCWQRGYDASACYMEYPIPMDVLTNITVDWLQEERRLLFVEAGGYDVNSIKVHVEGWW